MDYREYEKQRDRNLHAVFKKDNFRGIQKDVIDSICYSGKDVFAIMPTGAGKSLCYQLSALLLDGVIFVVSPLIALMQDQVENLIKFKIPAVSLNCTLPDEKYDYEINNILNKKYKLVYLSPERLLKKEIVNIIHKINIPLVVVDEAHCVSEWGHDFRKEYQDIPKFVENIISSSNKRPIVAAFTATATEETQEDIIKMLELKISNQDIKKTSIYRKNLNFKTYKVESEDERKDILFKIIRKWQNNETNKNESIIIYCTTKKKVYHLFKELNEQEEQGIRAVWYHGGYDYWKNTEEGRKKIKEKQDNFEKFMFGKVNIMVATTAFGMGIDKDNISYVIHFQMPLNLESYFQAAGRAGRDEKKVKEAECILFCKKSTKSSDYDTCMKIIKGKDGDNFREIDDEFEKIDDNIKFKEHKINLLNEMQNYVNTSECLYKFILNYFGEKNFEKCGKCNICKIDDIKKEKIEKENEKRIAERKEKDALIAEEQRLEAIKKNIDQSYERQRIEIKNNPDNFEAEICIDCGEYFAITHREVLRCNENRWGLPIRCRPCREKKKYGDLSRNR